MTDIEALIDRRIDRAAEFYRSSDTSVKYVAIIAGNVVGTYGDGATQAIADKIQRSVSTVQNFAHAKWLYDELRAVVGAKRFVRRLWRTLPISHWWLAYDEIHQKGGGALHYLNCAHQHRWSGRRMLQEFRVDWERENGAPPPVTPAKRLQQARNLVTSILAELDKYAPPIVEWARAGVILFGNDEK